MKKYTDVPGLAAHLCVAESTVRAWVRLLNIPVIRAGKLIRFDIARAEDWYENGGPNGLAAAVREEAGKRVANEKVIPEGAAGSARRVAVGG